jgi:aspartyl-tRNA(Asn)/glutamyl-tRNA(Gln) amidotransferase subunit B
MRSKEEAYDYRYFPEPDLVPVEPSVEWQEHVAASLPALPADRRATVAGASGMGADSDAVITVVRLGLDDLVDAVVTAGQGIEAAAVAVRRVANEVASDLEAAARLDRAAFARLVGMEAEGALTAAQARTVLKALMESGGDPERIASDLGFEAMDPNALETVVDGVIAAHPEEWARFSAGEDKLTGFFVGHIKAATDGKADLKAASALLRSRRS